ncbi:unnamed protein product [Colias eurytheme]|nr:unnamed protein product [Colias eurytheme]
MKGEPFVARPFLALGNNKHAASRGSPDRVLNSNCTLEFLIIEIINQNVPSGRATIKLEGGISSVSVATESLSALRPDEPGAIFVTRVFVEARFANYAEAECGPAKDERAVGLRAHAAPTPPRPTHPQPIYF